MSEHAEPVDVVITANDPLMTTMLDTCAEDALDLQGLSYRILAILSDSQYRDVIAPSDSVEQVARDRVVERILALEPRLIMSGLSSSTTATRHLDSGLLHQLKAVGGVMTDHREFLTRPRDERPADGRIPHGQPLFGAFGMGNHHQEEVEALLREGPLAFFASNGVQDFAQWFPHCAQLVGDDVFRGARAMNALTHESLSPLRSGASDNRLHVDYEPGWHDRVEAIRMLQLSYLPRVKEWGPLLEQVSFYQPDYRGDPEAYTRESHLSEAVKRMASVIEAISAVHPESDIGMAVHEIVNTATVMVSDLTFLLEGSLEPQDRKLIERVHTEWFQFQAFLNQISQTDSFEGDWRSCLDLPQTDPAVIQSLQCPEGTVFAVLDDDVRVHAVAQRAIREAGGRYRGVHSLADIESLAGEEVDVWLVDHRLQGNDRGTEGIGTIRVQHRGTTVIGHTADAGVDDVRRAFEAHGRVHVVGKGQWSEISEIIAA